MQEIIKILDALDSAVSCGIMSKQDAEEHKQMNIEKYITEEFSKYGAELKISYLESNGTYRIRISKAIQNSLNLKA